MTAAMMPEQHRAEDRIVVTGVVEHGDERGRQLGFPTANVRGVEHVRRDGVYAGIVQVDPGQDGPRYVAAVSVGHRPTYYGKEGLRLLEAHLLDVTENLYDREVRIELWVRLRPQHRYVDTPTLVRQLHLDVAATRAWARANGLQRLLGSPPPTRADRHRVGRAAIRDNQARVRARKARRLQLIARTAAEAPPDQLSHAWLAARTGLPVGYLTWHFPDLTVLRAPAGP